MAPRVAIVGGGVCGLTLARLLHVKGIDFTVYERYDDAASNKMGGSLDIHPEDGQRALRQAGLFEQLQQHARHEDDIFSLYDMHGKYYGGHQGRQKFVTPVNDAIALDEGRPEIDRVVLHDLLRESIPPERIQWGQVLKRVTVGQDGERILEFANGSTASGFDLIVGADGGFSKVRPLVSLPDVCIGHHIDISQITLAEPKYVGKYFIESRITTDNPLNETLAAQFGPGTHGLLGGPKQVMIQRQGDSSYRFYLGVTCPENFSGGVLDLADTDAARRLFLSSDFFGDWPPTIRNMIQTCSSFRPWPLYSLDPEDLSWETVPGVTLAGDAAHISVPAGEGVNIAMFDALVLANKIEEYGSTDLTRAVHEYEQDMFARGRKKITKSLASVNMMSRPDAPRVMVQFFQGKNPTHGS